LSNAIFLNMSSSVWLPGFASPTAGSPQSLGPSAKPDSLYELSVRSILDGES
jgi:hypothetical protein